MNDSEIRTRLYWVHTTFLLCIGCAIIFVVALTHDGWWLETRVAWFFALAVTHFLAAASLGGLAGKLGKGGISVGLAAFIATPVLLPFSYFRVVKWAHKALANSARSQINDELGGMPEMRVTSRDRL